MKFCEGLLTALVVQSTAGHAHNQFTCMLTCRHVHTMHNDTISSECPHIFYTQEHWRHKLFLFENWYLPQDTRRGGLQNVDNKRVHERLVPIMLPSLRHYRHNNSTMSHLIQYNMSPQLAHFIQPPVLFGTNLNENTVV